MKISNRYPLALMLAVAITASAMADEQDSQSERDAMMYYWGTTFGQQLQAVGINDAESLEQLFRGIADQANDRAPEYGQEYPSLLSNYLGKQQKAYAAREAEEANRFVAKMSRETRCHHDRFRARISRTFRRQRRPAHGRVGGARSLQRHTA